MRSKPKGISLPIEMIVVIAIAVLVLVVIAAFFVAGSRKLGVTSDSEAFSEGCKKLIGGGCTGYSSNITVENYISAQQQYFDRPQRAGSLAIACINMNKVLSASTIDPDCRRACGCPA